MIKLTRQAYQRLFEGSCIIILTIKGSDKYSEASNPPKAYRAYYRHKRLSEHTRDYQRLSETQGSVKTDKNGQKAPERLRVFGYFDVSEPLSGDYRGPGKKWIP
jgi:hypothetical protein